MPLLQLRPGALHRLKRGIGPAVRGVALLPVPNMPGLYITGFTLTGAGVALAGCTLKLYNVVTGMREQVFTSDGSGMFTSDPVKPGVLYNIDAYLAGTPDLAGTTVNTLAGSSNVNIYLRDPTAPTSAGGMSFGRRR